MKVQKIAMKDIKPGMIVRNGGRAANPKGEVLSCEPCEEFRNQWIVVFELADGSVSQLRMAGHGKMELH